MLIGLMTMSISVVYKLVGCDEHCRTFHWQRSSDAEYVFNRCVCCSELNVSVYVNMWAYECLCVYMKVWQHCYTSLYQCIRSCAAAAATIICVLSPFHSVSPYSNVYWRSCYTQNRIRSYKVNFLIALNIIRTTQFHPNSKYDTFHWDAILTITSR